MKRAYTEMSVSVYLKLSVGFLPHVGRRLAVGLHSGDLGSVEGGRRWSMEWFFVGFQRLCVGGDFEERNDE